MKKFLSVVLAVVMTMSLVTIAAGAKDFTDKSKVSYKEAVDVISTLGVVDGYTDGSFNPTATLTRGAAAKIICNLMLGPTTAGALGVTSAPYKDVPVSNVFAGYIAYCSQQGIINGYSDGTFRPSATVNGYQFMKMLLGALGYDGKIEGFTGSNWTVAVAKLAVSIGLDDGNDGFVGSKAMTREEAALYAFNTLTATMVKYDNKGSTIIVGGVEISQGASSAEPVTITSEGTANYAGSATDAPGLGTQQFCEKYFSKLKLTSLTDGLSRTANTWTYKNSKIGTYTNSDAVLSYNKDMTGTSDKNSLAADLKGYTYAASLKAYVNGSQSGSVITSSTDIASLTGNGVLVELYADGTQITKVVVVKSYVAQVTKLDKNNDTTTVVLKDASGTTMTTDSNYGSYAVDDYVMVVPKFNASAAIDSSKTVLAINATTKASGVVSYTSSSKATVDGTSYSKAAIVADSFNFGTTMALKANVDAYLDTYGYVVYAETSSADTNYVYLVSKYTKYGDTGATNAAQVVKPDGTVGYYEYVADDYSVSDVNYTGLTNKAVYNYTMSGSKISLSTPATGYVHSASLTGIASGAKSVTDGTVNGYFAGSTQFVSVTGTLSDVKVSVASGAQIVGAATNAVFITTKSVTSGNGTISTIFVDKAAVTNSTDLIYVKSTSASGYTTLNGNDYNTYTVYINGTKTEAALSDAPGAVGFYNYGKNSDGAYVLNGQPTNVKTTKTVDNLYNGYLTADTLEVNINNATIVDLTSNGIDTVAALNELVKTGATVTVSFVYDSNSKDASVVYVTGASCTLAATTTAITITIDDATHTTNYFSSVTYTYDGGAPTVSTSASITGTYTTGKVVTATVSTTNGYTLTTTDATVA